MAMRSGRDMPLRELLAGKSIKGREVLGEKSAKTELAHAGRKRVS